MPVMYTPKAFQVEDADRVHRVIDEFPFAMVIAGSTVSHLPLYREPGADGLKIVGHLARANPQCADLLDGAAATAVFQGPHTYITPTWYVKGDVPTWNYVAVHVKGTVRRIEEPERLIEILKNISEASEKKYGSNWRFAIPKDLQPLERLGRAIMGFEIEATEVEAKFKLNQNRSRADQDAVIAGLRSQRRDENSLAVARLMEELSTKR